MCSYKPFELDYRRFQYYLLNSVVLRQWHFYQSVQNIDELGLKNSQSSKGHLHIYSRPVDVDKYVGRVLCQSRLVLPLSLDFHLIHRQTVDHFLTSFQN